MNALSVLASMALVAQPILGQSSTASEKAAALSESTICELAERFGHVNARCFGAVPDDEKDDGPAIQAALVAAGQRLPVQLEAGVYLTSIPIDLSGKRLIGEQHWRAGGTVVRAVSAIGSVFFARSNAFRLEGVRIDAAKIADHGLRTFKTHLNETRVQNVTAANAIKSGFYFEYTMVATFEQLTAIDNVGDGIVIEDCNASRFSDLVVRRNAGRGIVVRAKSASGGTTVSGADLEENEGIPVLIEGVRTPTVIERMWIEQKAATDGVAIVNSQHVRLLNCRISAPSGGGNRAIRLSGASRACHLEGNSVASSNVDSGFEAIRMEAGSHSNTLVANDVLGGADSPRVEALDRNFSAMRAVSFASEPPAQGYWEKGDVVMNASPAIGSAPGWVCISDQPLVWAKLPAVTPWTQR